MWRLLAVCVAVVSMAMVKNTLWENCREHYAYWLFPLMLVMLSLLWRPRRKNWPPGPLAWPIVGHLPWLGQKAHVNLLKWTKRYGDIVAVKFGSEDVVVVNSYQAFKETYLSNVMEYSGKASLPLAKVFSDNGKGITFAPAGQSWKQQRKFLLRAMRLFNIGTSNINVIINQEVETFVSSVLRKQGEPFDIRPDITLAIANVTCAFVFGQPFQPDDIVSKRLVSSMNTIVVNLGSLGLFNSFPILSKISFLRFRNNKEDLESGCADLRRFVANMVDHHIQQPGPTNIVDAFLSEIQSRADNGKEEESFTSDQMMQTLFDTFIASFETVVSAFMWIVFYAARNPAMQRAVQEELDLVLKGDNVSVTHRRSLPVTEATVMEVLRLTSPSPINFRATSCDVQVRGYHLPAGTWTLMNLWAAHRDPKQWPDPDKFDINRFLDDGGKVTTPPAWRPFGIGGRACPGEQMARKELVVFFASLLQKFTLSLHVPDGSPVPSEEDAVLGMALLPAAFHVRAVARDPN